ncbi:hypothetical protein AOLI_G00065750 [Acnodon oligacanthus]
MFLLESRCGTLASNLQTDTGASVGIEDNYQTRSSGRSTIRYRETETLWARSSGQCTVDSHQEPETSQHCFDSDKKEKFEEASCYVANVTAFALGTEILRVPSTLINRPPHRRRKEMAKRKPENFCELPAVNRMSSESVHLLQADSS